MSNTTLKYYIIPVIILVIVVVIILLVSSTKKSSTNNANPQPTTSQLQPTTHNLPTNQPSIIPPANFTGAESTQTLPPEMKNVGEQKTSLRRLAPLALDFAIIEFDYENDVFLVQLSEPKTNSLTQFNAWKNQNYPALTEDKFVIN